MPHTFKLLSEVISVDRVTAGEILPTDIVVGWADVAHDELPTMTIHQRWKQREGRWGETTSYAVSEIPVGNGFDGRAFTLRKLEAEANAPTCETYDVFVARNGLDNICDCPGHTYKGYCKHVDALRGLIERGTLAHPLERPEATVELAPEWDDAAHLDPFGMPLDTPPEVATPAPRERFAFEAEWL
jgi:hypothetical protein